MWLGSCTKRRGRRCSRRDQNSAYTAVSLRVGTSITISGYSRLMMLQNELRVMTLALRGFLNVISADNVEPMSYSEQATMISSIETSNSELHQAKHQIGSIFEANRYARTLFGCSCAKRAASPKSELPFDLSPPLRICRTWRRTRLRSFKEGDIDETGAPCSAVAPGRLLRP